MWGKMYCSNVWTCPSSSCHSKSTLRRCLMKQPAESVWWLCISRNCDFGTPFPPSCNYQPFVAGMRACRLQLNVPPPPLCRKARGFDVHNKTHISLLVLHPTGHWFALTAVSSLSLMSWLCIFLCVCVCVCLRAPVSLFMSKYILKNVDTPLAFHIS